MIIKIVMGKIINDSSLEIMSTSNAMEINKVFEDLTFKESFFDASELILKFVSSKISLEVNSKKKKELLAEDVQYVLKQIISGMASSRKFLRHGCYTTLQAVLQDHHQCLDFVVTFMNEFYKNIPKENMNDHSIGHLMTLGAIIRSGNLLEGDSLSKDIAKNLLRLRRINSSFDPIVGQFLVNLLILYNNKAIARMVWEEVRDEIQGDFQSLSPSLLWLRLIFSRDDYALVLSGITKDFVSKMYNQSSFIEMLQTFQKLTEEEVNVSPLIDDYFKTLVFGRNEQDPGYLESFFDIAVKPSLATSSPKMISFYFNITQMALLYLTTKTQILKVLNKDILELIISSRKLNSDLVDTSAKGLLAATLQRAVKCKEEQNVVQFEILNQLICTSASLRFDAATETTILQQMMEQLNSETAKEFSTLLTAVMVKCNKRDMKLKNRSYQNALSAVEFLCRLVYHPRLIGPEFVEWRSCQVVSIIEFTFFRNHPSLQFLRLRDCYLRSLNQLTKKLDEQVVLVSKVAIGTEALFSLHSSDCSLNDEARSCFSSCVSRVHQFTMEGDTHGAHKDVLAIKLIYGHIALHLFINADNSLKLLNEVEYCLKENLKRDRMTNKSSQTSNEEFAEELLKLLLFILSQEERYWRNVVVSIFKYVCHFLSPISLYLLNDVIDTRIKDSTGEGEIEEEDESGGEEAFGDESDYDSQDSSLSENDDDDDDESSCADEDETFSQSDEAKLKMIQLKMEMQKLVGIPTEDDLDIDSIPKEQLKSLDVRLGTMVGEFLSLKQKRNNSKLNLKKEEKKDETAVMHFRTRVCDLIEALMNEAPSVSHLLEVMEPLLLSLNWTTNKEKEKPLMQRLRAIFVDLGKVRKFAKSDSTTMNQLTEKLKSLLALHKKGTVNVTKELSICCNFVLRSALHQATTENDAQCSRLFEVYSSYVSRNFKSDINLIDGPLHLDTGHLSVVLLKMLELCFMPSMRPFIMNRGLEMIKSILMNDSATSKMDDEVLKRIHESLSASVVKSYDSMQEAENVQPPILTSINELLKSLRNIHKRKPVWCSWFDWSRVRSCIIAFGDRFDVNSHKSLRKSLVPIATELNFNLKRSSDAIGNKISEKKKRKLDDEKCDSAKLKKALNILKGTSASGGSGTKGHSDVLTTGHEFNTSKLSKTRKSKWSNKQLRKGQKESKIDSLNQTGNEDPEEMDRTEDILNKRKKKQQQSQTVKMEEWLGSNKVIKRKENNIRKTKKEEESVKNNEEIIKKSPQSLKKKNEDKSLKKTGGVLKNKKDGESINKNTLNLNNNEESLKANVVSIKKRELQCLKNDKVTLDARNKEGLKKRKKESMKKIIEENIRKPQSLKKEKEDLKSNGEGSNKRKDVSIKKNNEETPNERKERLNKRKQELKRQRLERARAMPSLRYDPELENFSFTSLGDIF